MSFCRLFLNLIKWQTQAHKHTHTHTHPFSIYKRTYRARPGSAMPFSLGLSVISFYNFFEFVKRLNN